MVLNGRRGLLAAMLAASLAAGGLQLLLPGIAGLIADTLVDGRLASFGRVMTLTAVLASTWVLAACARCLAGVLGGHLGASVAAAIRIRLHEHVLRAELLWTKQLPPGEVQSLAGEQAEHFARVFSQALPFFAVHGMITLGTASVLLAREPILAVATLVPLGAMVAISAQRHLAFIGLFQEHGRLLANLCALAGETARSLWTIKVFAAEDERQARLVSDAMHLALAEARAQGTVATYSSGVMAATGVAVAGTWFMGGHRIISGSEAWTVGDLVAFTTLAALLYQPLAACMEILALVSRGRAAAARIAAVLVLPTERASDAPPAFRAPVGIRFAGVRFSYNPRHEVLRGIDLAIGPGEFVGIVGRSGAGKSTLVSLLLRFRQPDGGMIIVNDKPIEHLDLQGWRRSVGVVLQETVLFEGTIQENLRCGRDWVSDADIIDAAKRAKAHDFAVRLPAGYATLVGTGGLQLSGGQRQRIGIARAIAARPAFLVLDEATSALDGETEAAVIEGMRQAAVGTTIIVVSHRPSILIRANHVAVLDDGCVVEQGRFAELLAKPGSMLARLMEPSISGTLDIAAGGYERVQSGSGDLGDSTPIPLCTDRDLE